MEEIIIIANKEEWGIVITMGITPTHLLICAGTNETNTTPTNSTKTKTSTIAT